MEASWYVPMLYALVGGLISVMGQVALHIFKDRPHAKVKKIRMEMLTYLLDPKRRPDGSPWRDVTDLQRFIGASEEETKSLLLQIGARGGLMENDVWALMEYRPLPNGPEGEV